MQVLTDHGCLLFLRHQILSEKTILYNIVMYVTDCIRSLLWVPFESEITIPRAPTAGDLTIYSKT